MGTDETRSRFANLGAWITPTCFEFYQPYALLGRTVQRVDVSAFMTSDVDLTPDVLLGALLNQADPPVQLDDIEELEELTCKGCGMKGIGPAGAAEDVWCPQCLKDLDVEH